MHDLIKKGFLILGMTLSVCVLGSDPSGDTLFRFQWAQTYNYSKSAYGADIQNWSITQDEEGMMYFANNEGLLRFDGSEWELFPHPDNLLIRSVAAGPEGRIYSGSYEDFGYWEDDMYGHMHYHSIKNLVRDFTFNNHEIWRILVRNDSVWFQSFTVVFLFDGQSVKTLNAPGVMTCFTNVGDEILARITGRGLYRIDKEGFVLLDSSDFMKEHMIRVILPLEGENLLIATSEDGLYRYSRDNSLEAWNPGASESMRDRVINRGLLTSSGEYIFGTQLYGAFVFDSSGRFLYSLSQESGLQNNTVLGMYIDRQAHLWLGLDNGIDMVDLRSGITYHRDDNGVIGAVYSVMIHQDKLYAGTNRGLFYTDLGTTERSGITGLDFQLIPGTESQVWSLDRYGDQLFCGHNTGTFKIDDAIITRISSVSGGYTIKPLLHSDGRYLIQGTYTSLVLYENRGTGWEFSHIINGFAQPIKYIESDHLGNIWAGHNTKGLFRIVLDNDYREIETISYYGREKGFESDYQIGVFRMENRILFLNEGKSFAYDDLRDTIVPFEPLRSEPELENIHRIVPVGADQFWFISADQLSLYTYTSGTLDRLASFPFDQFGNRQIRSYEFIRRINDRQSILCLDNGFALLPHEVALSETPRNPPFFKQIYAYGGGQQHDLIANQPPNEPPLEIRYRFNSILLRFASPSFGSSIRYHLRLNGLDDEWITTQGSEYRFERLPAGDYTLLLKAEDGRGSESGVLRWSFRIMAPWYWSVLSRIMYVLLFFFILFLMSRYFMKRLTVQERKLRAEQEAEIIRLRNEQLRSEVSYKSKELANTTFNIMKKNELFIEVREALEKEKKSLPPEQRNSLNRIARMVEGNISHEDDWSVFENNFERAHEEFLYRISERYPDLTPGDLKLCAYLRMNLSTKKIALLLGISVRGVENHRYRLRKKIGLDREANLTEFMMKF